VRQRTSRDYQILGNVAKYMPSIKFL